MVRIYLSGRMTVEVGGARLAPEDLPGRQGRLAFAYLVGERRHPVSRSALADVLWSGRPPPSWSDSLSAVVSKLRSALSRIGLDGSAVLDASGGCYRFVPPRDCWIDHPAAESAIHEAEAALEEGHFRRAYGPSAVALLIARRPFLPGHEGKWLVPRRRKLGGIRIRALECRSVIYLRNGEGALAVEAAREVVERRRFRESGYRMLMRAHLESGNAAEALRVYERCRRLMREELGASPSRETKELRSDVLASL